MKKICFIVTGILLIMKIHAQHYSEDLKTFTFKNTAYEIVVAEDEGQYGYKAFLNIYNIKYGHNKLIKTTEILDTTYDADLITFGEYVNEEKRYVLIQHRYCFYILNLYKNVLLGPYYPNFYGIGEDAQSGMAVGLKIIFDGRFIMGYCVDSGCFLYDLSDIYIPKEVIPVTNPLYSENRVYVLKQYDNKGKQFGIHLKCEGWNCTETFLFKDKVIKTTRNADKIKPEEIPEPEFPYAEYNYTILKELLSDNKYNFFVYDNYTGKEVDLPESLTDSNEQKIKRFLNER